MADLRASLDEENEVKPAIRRPVEREFNRGPGIQKVYFPEDGYTVSDDPQMTLVVMSPTEEGCPMDREERHGFQTLPGSICLVYPEAWPGPSGQRGGLVRLAEGKGRGGRGDPGA